MTYTKRNDTEWTLHIDSLTDAELAEYKRVFIYHPLRLVDVNDKNSDVVGPMFAIHALVDKIQERRNRKFARWQVTR